MRYSRVVPGERGFTLIELLVVLSLISILAAMGMVQHRNSVLKAQEATLKTDLFHMRDAIDQYFADKGKYPASPDALVTDNYLRKIPEDPLTHSTESWQTVPAEPDPSNPSAEPGTIRRPRAAHKERRWTGRTIRTGSQHSRQLFGRSAVAVDSQCRQSAIAVDGQRRQSAVAVDGWRRQPHVSHGKK
jgi:general secretion pathway protein G